MPKFLKTTLLYVLRGILALVAMYAISGLATYLLIEELKPSVPESSILIIDLEDGWVETAPALATADLLKAQLLKQVNPNPLLGSIEAIQAAQSDPRIKGLLLVGDMRNASTNVIGLSGYNELGQAIAAFGESKPTFAYLRLPGMGELLLSSYCNKRYIDPLGKALIQGVGSETLFFGKAFSEYGVNVQVAKAGTFKSAVEPYIQESFSANAKQQQQRLIDAVWGTYKGTLAANLGVQTDTIDEWAEQVMVTPAQFGEAIPSLPYSELVQALQLLAGNSKDLESTFSQVDIASYSYTLEPSEAQPVAVITVQGAIGLPGKGVDVDLLTRQLRDIRYHNKHSALVLRVNSPGGGVYPSQRIARELVEIKKLMPVYVSMGQYAASGGYWIAALGTEVSATPFTLTGSIGVFAITFDIQKAANNLGLAWDRTNSTTNSGLFSVTAPKTPAELSILQAEVEGTYSDFTAWVSTERHLSEEDVALLAEGQVWSGTEGLALGLLDNTSGFVTLQQDLQTRLGDYSLDYSSSSRPKNKFLGYLFSKAPMLQQAATQAESINYLSGPHALQSLNLTRLTF